MNDQNYARDKLINLFETIISFISSSDFELRKEALISISKLRGQIAGEIVFSKLQTSNIEDYLFYIVNKIDISRASKELVNALNDQNIDIRIKAANILLSTKDDEITNTLIKAVESYLEKANFNDINLITEDALIIATKALGEIGTPYCIGLLRKLAINDSNSKVRATAVAALSKYVNESYLPLLQAILKDPDTRVRANAIEAIQRINKPIIIGILQPYLYDSNQRVKANAVKAIWKFGDYDVTNVLKEMLLNKDDNQIASALYAIGESKINFFYKNLFLYLNHENENIRKNAIIAIKKFRNQDSIPELIKCLNDKSKNNRITAINALVEINIDKTSEIIIKHLIEKESDRDVKAYIIKLLAKHSKIKISQIINFIKEDDENLVCATIEALDTLSGTNPSASYLLAIENIKNTPSLIVKQKLIEILWKWGITDCIDMLLNLLKASSKPEILCGIKTAGNIFEKISISNHFTLEMYENILFEVVEKFKSEFYQTSSKAISDQIKNLIELAQNSIKSHKLSEALIHYENILKISPYNIQALLGFAEIAMSLNNFEEAKVKYLKALEIDKNLVKAHFGLGKIYFFQKDFKNAIDHLTKSITLYPNLPQAYYLLCEANINIQNFVDAYHCIKKVAKVTAQNITILQKLAILAFINNDFDISLSIVRKLVGKNELEIGVKILQAYLEFIESSDKKKSFLFFIKFINSYLYNKIQTTPIYLPTLFKKIESHIEKTQFTISNTR